MTLLGRHNLISRLAVLQASRITACSTWLHQDRGYAVSPLFNFDNDEKETKEPSLGSTKITHPAEEKCNALVHIYV